MADMTDFRARPGLDPTKDAALLLQRIAFFTLGIALPVSAMLSRRAAVVLVPIAVALFVIAALLWEPDRFIRSLQRRAVKATALALGLLAAWTFLSLSWAPRGVPGADRPLNMLFALVLGIVAVAALPERVRAANLNALAVGSGVATIVAGLTQLTGFGLGEAEDDVTVLVRGLATVLLFAGPLVAWLLSRGRSKGALAMFGAVAAAAILSREPAVILALGAGFVAFGVVLTYPAHAARRIAAFCGALILAAPALAWIGRWLAEALAGAGHPLVAQFRAWSQVILDAPVKLVTGHGFGALGSPRGPGSDALPPSILVDLWYDLGLVGAFALASTLFFAIRAVRVLPPVVQAGAIAAYVAALTLGLLGLAGFRAWWLMTLVAAVLLTTAVARGQARTDRPLARFVKPAALSGAPTRPGVPGG